MDAKLVLDEKYYYLETQHERIGKMIVGSSDHELSRIVNQPFKLSTKNCEAIKNGYDLDELAENHALEVYDKVEADEDYQDYANFNNRRNNFKEGFQKALEILGDKKFSEGDMISAYNRGGNDGAYYESACGDHDSYEQMKEAQDESEQSEKEFIQSLQQTEFDVEIEMECPECQSWGYISECRNNCNQKFLQPKLDANGCIILKRK